MGTPSFCTWEECRQRVADALHVPAGQLSAEWAGLCSRGVKDAAAELKRVFVVKGYAVAQLAACDDVRIWNERLGAFYALCNGTSLAAYDLKSVEHLDCRKEFAEAGVLVIGDAAVAPSANSGDVGGTDYGQTDAARQVLDPHGRGGFGAGYDWTW